MSAKLSTEKDREHDLGDNRCVFQLSLKDLVNAGELQYTDKTIKQVAIDIANKFKADTNRDYNLLLLDALQPMMYLLKREQNLADFCGPLRSSLSKERSIPKTSQRLLVDTMMMNSDRFLCQRLTLLLSKRNPVPMIQMSMATPNKKYRFMSSIPHVWDCSRPVILSFGVGTCNGKTPLVNALFEASFEQSVKDEYFRGTIDVDFGYHFVERRSINIADVHGEISGEAVERISKLFNGFIVHVEKTYFLSNTSYVKNLLQLLPHVSYVLLLVRDLDDEENDMEIETAVESVRSVCPNCQFYYLPNVADKNTVDNVEKIDQLREKLFHDAANLVCHDETYIQKQFEQLMDDDQRQFAIEDNVLLDKVRPILINGMDNDYPLYSLFTRMCQTRLAIAKMDPYQANFQDKKLYDLHNELFQVTKELERKQRAGDSENGSAFNLFMTLLEKQEARLKNLNLLFIALKHSRDKNKVVNTSESVIQPLSLEIHWRNAIISSTHLSNHQQKILVDTYYEYISEGNPFEIVDGDNFEMQGQFLTKAFRLLDHKKIFIISIIGPQNSGKSTLLNFLFGTMFEVREGRCTKGIYGTLVNIDCTTTKHNLVPPDYDYILVVDTEGLSSIQKGDEQYDKRLTLFCLAVSHLVIVNISGEINETLKQMLLLCTQSLNYIGETRVTRPTVHFVLNQKSDPNKDNCDQQVKIVREDLIRNHLQNLIDLGPNNFHVLTTAFNRKPFLDPNGECAALSTDIKFVTSVQNLCKLFMNSSLDIIHRTGDRFSTPTKWIEFARSVLQVIKKYPDLTFFKDIFERDQHNKVREDIRKDFKSYLSPEYVSQLIEQNKEETSDRIKDSFKIEQSKILTILESNLEENIRKHAVSENIRDRSMHFLQAQVVSLFRSWEVSAIMAAERNELDKIVHDGENQLRRLADCAMGQNQFMDKTTAINKFEMMWKDRFARIERHFDPEFQWKQSINLVCRLYDVLDKDALPSLDNVLSYLPFLMLLHTSDQTSFMDRILEKICAECISKAANICPLAPCTGDMSNTSQSDALFRKYEFLNDAELVKLSPATEHTRGGLTRSAFKKSIRSDFSQEINNRWELIVRVFHCFEILIERIGAILKSKINDKSSHEIVLLQEILGTVNKLIQDMNVEFNIFNFTLSKNFQSLLHICAVISVAAFYYNQHKAHFDGVLRSVRLNKDKLQDRFVRMVVLQENDDKNIAKNLVNELIEVLHQSFQMKIIEIIRKLMENESATLDRSRIITKLDNEVFDATDEWLMRYILHPSNTIIECFNQQWKNIDTKIHQQLQINLSTNLDILNEFFRIIEEIINVLRRKGADSLTFVDDLFVESSDNGNQNLSEKKVCMATLVYQYLTGEPSSTSITTKSGAIYSVNSTWQEIINESLQPSDLLKDTFRSIKKTFETYNISYLCFFLDEIVNHKAETKNTVNQQLNDSIEQHCHITREQWLIRIRGCEALCPCCKRLCDTDHRLDNASPIGQGENRHRCQFGHQIRGMGGIRYEVTNEASTEWCENIKDDDPIIIRQGIRQTWKDFKNICIDWDFGDPRIRETQETSYAYIWNRIGEQLCQHFGNGMRFVTQNSPVPANHFILVLDHSGSMNSSNKTNLSPWEHLLKAVQEFIRVRIQKICPTDRMSIIVFGSRAIRVYNREKLTQIDIDRINVPKTTCGSSTHFSVAFNNVIQILDEIQQEAVQTNLRQTIIFMTDGEPHDYPTVELERLSTQYSSMIANFWTMGLGNYNKKILQKVNETMKGKLVDIEKPEDLSDAYAEIADIADGNQPEN